MSNDYTWIPDLAEIVLEESYVLEVVEESDRLAFRLDLVLTPRHPEYHQPLPNEQECYRDGWLTFDGLERIEWLSRSDSRTVGPDGDVDYGDFDALITLPDGFQILADLGEVRLWTKNLPTVWLA